MLTSISNERFKVVNPLPKHFKEIQDLCRKVYPFTLPWSIEQLESHHSKFPDGQLIVIDKNSDDRVVGMAFSLIVQWKDYSPQDNWKDFTSGGYFYNHDPKGGVTLYGAEVMVDPELRGQGIGKMLYQARVLIVEKYKLKRIRAGARLRGYSTYKDKFSPAEYVKQVVQNKIYDPTLSFQLKQGFVVIDVVKKYLSEDPESLGNAAIIEWLNPKVINLADQKKQQMRVKSLMEDLKYIPEHLPKELRRIVRKAALILGFVLRECEGDAFYHQVNGYREKLKKVRFRKDSSLLKKLNLEVSSLGHGSQYKIAHTFSLYLELINMCESAYRTWVQRKKTVPINLKNKIDIIMVLTAHPTEARSKFVIEIYQKIVKSLITGMENNFNFNDNELISYITTLWHIPLTKPRKPTVYDEAEYIFSLIFSDDLFDFIIQDKPSFELKLRTWVGGDKDGHPNLDKLVMRDCLNISRKHLITVIEHKLQVMLNDLIQVDIHGLELKKDIKKIQTFIEDLLGLSVIKVGDGTSVKKWTIKLNQYLKSSTSYIKNHYQFELISKILKLYPALVIPIELRDSATEIHDALKNPKNTIRQSLVELKKIAGALEVAYYARGLVISQCELPEDISAACKLVDITLNHRKIHVIPLFESKKSLQHSKKILTKWFSTSGNKDRVKRFWGSAFEVMLGYSDSSKESGALSSRLKIKNAMFDLENFFRKLNIKPVFFHGSGGSVTRGGGALKEQISWWPMSAINLPKITVQGEMIHRTFSTSEILNSQCSHLAHEAMRKKSKKIKNVNPEVLLKFAASCENAYQSIVNDSVVLEKLLSASPFRHLNEFNIGSRPNSRITKGSVVTTKSLRAIPWVLCWTQNRLLLPAWWGTGSSWNKLSQLEKDEFKKIIQTDSFFASYVKTIGFTLAKVELDIWELYAQDFCNKELIERVRAEFESAVNFFKDVTAQNNFIWHKPWLEESIKLRAPNIHILNMLQISAMKQKNFQLLRETLVGISSGMLTTG